VVLGILNLIGDDLTRTTPGTGTLIIIYDFVCTVLSPVLVSSPDN